jgi:hypothetical protein
MERFDGALRLKTLRVAEYSYLVRELTTCRSCHRFIASDFSYCPYCGLERVRHYEFRRLLDAPFDRMELDVQEYSLRRLEELERQLDVLEIDLQRLLDRISF